MNLTDMMGALNEMGMLFESETVERRQKDPLFHYHVTVTALSEHDTVLSYSRIIAPNTAHSTELLLGALRDSFIKSLKKEVIK